MLLGLLYWLLGLVAVRLWWDALYKVPSIFFLGFLGQHSLRNRHLWINCAENRRSSSNHPTIAAAPGTFVDFRPNGRGAAYQAEGWSLPDEAGTWTNGPRGEPGR
jgi:hypothetical protein